MSNFCRFKNIIAWFVAFTISIIFIFSYSACQIKKDLLVVTTETTQEIIVSQTTLPESQVETIPDTTFAADTTSTTEPSPTTFEYEKNKIRIGGSAIGRWAITNEYSTGNEVRVLQNNQHKHADEYIRFCIKNNIYCIINIDFFVGSWHPSNQELRNFTISLKNKVKDLGGTKEMVRFTVDNESDKWTDFNSYLNYVRVVNDALNEEFDIGAGNFTSSNKSWYESLARVYSEGWFDVYDIHMQSGFSNIDEIEENSRWFRRIIDTYGLSRRSCTEANNSFDVIADYKIIKLLISKAQFMELEDFCIAFFDYIPNNNEPNMEMSFWLNGSPRDVEICNDFAELINSLKP